MILIVDDKEENIYSLRRLLETSGFEVDAALSGEDALKKILKNTYSLIILDVQMPGMDGFEVAEAVAGYSKAKDIPIIFLSAVNTDKRFITKGYVAGGIDYVTKPIDPDVLMLKVKTFSRLYEQSRQLMDTQANLRQEIEIRKKAQQEQHVKAQELHSILEAIPQIAFTANPAGEIEYVNEHWYTYSDHKNSFPAVMHTPSFLQDEWKNIISGAQPLTIEVCIRKLADAAHRYHLLKVTPVKQDGEIVKWVGTFTDIHEQKQLTEILERRVEERTRELQKMNKELESSNVDLQQFASVASHDLKEPLRKIQVFSSIVRERYSADVRKEVAQYLDKIIASSDRMTTLINDLLTFSRLSVASPFQHTDLNRMVKDILNDLEIAIREKSAIINVGTMPALDIIPGQIRQMFQNIISNALKFTLQDQVPVINIRAELVAAMDFDAAPAPEGEFCRIRISDNGIGFDEIYLDKIFTIFQRLNSREDYEGTGIGLAIAKKIIDKHNGIITARSAEHAGATFIMVVPVHQVEDQPVNK